MTGTSRYPVRLGFRTQGLGFRVWGATCVFEVGDELACGPLHNLQTLVIFRCLDHQFFPRPRVPVHLRHENQYI